MRKNKIKEKREAKEKKKITEGNNVKEKGERDFRRNKSRKKTNKNLIQRIEEK